MKQTFGAVQLGSVQLENLIADTINLAMNQNAGLAIVKMRKNGFEPGNKLDGLNDELNNIMLCARRQMHKAIQDYLNSLNCPVS